MEVTITRDDISKNHVKYLKKGTPWQADVILINKEGYHAVVKDYSKRGFVCRVFLGSFVTWRESYIYSRLHDLEGIPDFYGRIDKYAFAIEFIDGKTSAEYRKGEVPASLFDDIKQLISKIHARRIVLCDMRNNKNIIITKDFKPFLIDFAASFTRGWRVNLLKKILFDLFAQDDLLGIAKLKKRLYPELLSVQEAEKLEKGLPFQTNAILIRNTIRKYLKKLVAKAT